MVKSIDITVGFPLNTRSRAVINFSIDDLHTSSFAYGRKLKIVARPYCIVFCSKDFFQRL